jgi:GlpG protein
LHFGIMHILFNMMWLFTLGSQIEEKKGRVKFLLIFIVIAVVSNLAQYIYAGPSFGGMSGVVFGLMGYIWMKMKFQPLEGISIDPQNINFMMIWLVVCMTGLVGPIANACHLIGLLTGVFLGYLPVLLSKLNKRI